MAVPTAVPQAAVDKIAALAEAHNIAAVPASPVDKTAALAAAHNTAAVQASAAYTFQLYALDRYKTNM
jgi:hypothetical protein